MYCLFYYSLTNRLSFCSPFFPQPYFYDLLTSVLRISLYDLACAEGMTGRARRTCYALWCREKTANERQKPHAANPVQEPTVSEAVLNFEQLCASAVFRSNVGHVGCAQIFKERNVDEEVGAHFRLTLKHLTENGIPAKRHHNSCASSINPPKKKIKKNSGMISGLHLP